MAEQLGLKGTVALITGAARGQGREHARLLAQAGADVIAIDICRDIASIPYSLATPADLEVTRSLVEREGRRVITVQADVRSRAQMDAAVEAGLAAFGHINIIVANAGIIGWPTDDRRAEPLRDWSDTLDVNLTGVWNTIAAARSAMEGGGAGGSIVIVNSSNGLKGLGTDSAAGYAYTASKHALVGLMRAYARSLAPHRIRVNSVHPTGVSTRMVTNAVMQEFWSGPLAPTNVVHLLPVDLIEAIDVSRAVVFLSSESARYITGVALPVDAGVAAS